MKNVTVFTTKTCPHCRTAKEFLKQQNIYFVEKDVNVDAQARAEMMRRNVTGVPAVLIGDDIVIGLDRGKILSLVDHRLVSCESCKTGLRVPINKGKIKVTCPKCGHSFESEPR